MQAMRAYARSLDPHLPSVVWVLQAGVLVNFFGNGLVGPFLVLYLHIARGLPIGLAAAAIATGGITAITSGFVAGWLVDRTDPKKVVALAMTSNAIAYALYLGVSEPWHAFVVAALVGVGTGMYGPSSQTLLSGLVPADQRHRAFAQNRISSLVGLGTGGLAGGLIVSSGRASQYELLLVLDVITFLAFAAVLLALPVRLPPRAATRSGGYATVLRDRSMLGLALTNLALVSAGIAPMFVLLPAFLKTYPEVPEAAIGALYALDTVAIIALQMPLARLVEGHRRMPLLAGGALLWVGSWSLIEIAGGSLAGLAAAAVAAIAILLYAVGESLYAVVVTPTAAALAPEALRGRYLAVLGFSWQGGYMLGPAIGGQLLVASSVALPTVALIVCAAAAAGALVLERTMPEETRRTPKR